MVTNEERESSTSAFMLWNCGAHFLGASQKLGTDHLPALYLACHGTELALKSHLRANGYTLSQLKHRNIRHSISELLSHGLKSGMRKPPALIRTVLDFANGVHQSHDYRYPHALVRAVPVWNFVLAGG
jgi:hypothetical protein